MEMNSIQCLEVRPIGVLHSPYGEKFAVPRQPNLVAQGKGIVRLLPPYNQSDAVRGLEKFSHIWLIFQFHHIPEREWHATVRPPRLGGNERVGVFASRATHRPNPIGLSKVRLEQIVCKNGEVLLYLGSVDLVDGTPILDIKPYLAFADSEPTAISSFAQQAPSKKLTVTFSSNAQQAIQCCPNFAKFGIDDPQSFITEVIEQDPRPAYRWGKLDSNVYGITLAGYNVRWRLQKNSVDCVEVLSIELIEDSTY